MSKFLILIVVTIFSLQPVFTNADNKPTVKEQLENLNIGWKDKNFDDQILKERILLNDEVKLIQTHLSLVEQKLRNKCTDNLSTEQKRNRLKCLDILQNYWTKGNFPKNLYHNKRTPYFIDDYGTACAVGQLIISTGYEKFAKRISKENNYSYIVELNEKYLAIKKWADEYGFAIEELAWIQPGYVICDTACSLGATISVMFGNPPYTYLWNPSGQTSASATGLCPSAAYTCTVIDALGDSVPPGNCDIYFGTQISSGTNVLIIPAAYPLYINLSSTDDDGSCNGTATVNITSGASPFSYYWQPGGQTTQTATGLCQGIYNASVLDMNFCFRIDSVIVNNATGVNQGNYNNFISTFPNPFTDKILIKLQKQNINQASISVKSIFGQTVFSNQENNLGSSYTKTIDLSFLSKGIYLFDVIIDGERTVKKIVKK